MVARVDDEAATSEQVRKVFRFFDRRDGVWRFENSGFAVNRRTTIGRRGLVLNYKIHANRVARQRVSYRASITIWPVRSSPQTVSMFPLEWQKAVVRQLKGYGYHGKFRIEWRKYYFGDFWKRLRDLSAVAAEVKQLEAWAGKPSWLPSTLAQAKSTASAGRGVGRRRTRG
jgi:hypothetical protein